MASATSDASRSPIVGSVTTANSAPVAVLSRRAIESMVAADAPSTTPATSVRYPAGLPGKRESTGDCAASAPTQPGELKREGEAGSFERSRHPAPSDHEPPVSRWFISLLLLTAACESSRDVTVIAVIPGLDSGGTAATGFAFIVLPYDRDSLVTAFESRATTPRPATAALDSLFAQFRAPFASYTALVAKAAQYNDTLRSLRRQLDTIPSTSAGYGRLYSAVAGAAGHPAHDRHPGRPCAGDARSLAGAVREAERLAPRHGAPLGR